MTEKNRVKFGFAQTVITPMPQTVFLDGFGERITPAEGVRDDLYVKIFVIRSAAFRFALAVFDACGFEERIAVGIRRRIAVKNALPLHCVSVLATHTHSAPASGVLGDIPVNYFWWDQAGEAAALAAQEAFRQAAPCRAAFLRAGELSSVKNRRGGKLCDKRVKICAFYNERNALTGVLVLASCHATCYSGMKISADYPAVLTRKMQEIYPNVPVLFLQGRGADANPCLPDSLGDDGRLERLGAELAERVITALENPHDGIVRTICSPSAGTREIQVPMQPYADAQTLRDMIAFFERQRDAAADIFGSRRIVREIYWHQKALRQAVSQKNTENHLSVELQVLKLSEEAVFLLLPFEVFNETGAFLEKYCVAHGYDPLAVFIAGHANGTNGYLVPGSEFLSGDYERHDMQYWYQKTLLAAATGADELTFGHYEPINAPHWYDLPQCCRKSEETVINELIKILSQRSR